MGVSRFDYCVYHIIFWLYSVLDVLSLDLDLLNLKIKSYPKIYVILLIIMTILSEFILSSYIIDNYRRMFFFFLCFKHSMCAN